jgi:hypothetical protein
MRNLDSRRCWRCTLCACKVRNKFLVNFWNRTILLCILCISQINVCMTSSVLKMPHNLIISLSVLIIYLYFTNSVYFVFLWLASHPLLTFTTLYIYGMYNVCTYVMTSKWHRLGLYQCRTLTQHNSCWLLLVPISAGRVICEHCRRLFVSKSLNHSLNWAERKGIDTTQKRKVEETKQRGKRWYPHTKASKWANHPGEIRQRSEEMNIFPTKSLAKRN